MSLHPIPTIDDLIDRANRVHRKYRQKLEAQTGVGSDGLIAWIWISATAYSSPPTGELDGVPIRIFRVPVPTSVSFDGF